MPSPHQPNITRDSRRDFLRKAAAITALNALPVGCSRPKNSLTDVRVGMIGFHGQGMHHLKHLVEELHGVRVVALCDVDTRTMDDGVEYLKKHDLVARQYVDYRELCADKEVDGVIIATPHHSHVLIALTAMANGKHVYVEKPVSHNLWEGRKLVEAAAKRPNLIVQHGMQRRSDEGWEQAIAWVNEGHIGKVTLSRGLNYKSRESIGSEPGPGRTAKFINYDLWSACREPVPVTRDRFHYDWHWQWAYGNGDIGNQGPHQLDVARWALGQMTLPRRVMSLGNRWGYKDDGETPNNQLAFFDYEPVPLIFDNRGLPMKDMDWRVEPVWRQPIGAGHVDFPRIGNVIHCEGGLVAESKAYDKDGKVIKSFDVRGGGDHLAAWLDSIRAGKPKSENLSILNGHLSAGLAHLANISYRVGKTMKPEEIRERLQGNAAALDTLTNFEENLRANKIDWNSDLAVTGPWLEFDPATERFTGEFSEEANKLLTEEYRKGFELPEIG
jgi:predicted dehydrogenase